MILTALAVVSGLGTQPPIKASLCRKASTTIEINDCLNGEVAKATKTLDRYRAAARRQIAADGPARDVLAAFNAADRAWRVFEKASCDAVYEQWKEGTIRGAVYAMCELRLTRIQTHGVWHDWLTYPDSTPPVLPEPVIETDL